MGENAGVVDLGQGEKVAFKIESHNHPSQISPYHGASTGVGGILRDVFVMNARPLALANYLCFGSPLTDSMADLMDGVVRGIGGYGNCIGIPTITGQTEFHPSYNNNIVVNAFALGYFGPEDKVISSQVPAEDLLLVYVGASTGRDGIHGASMASESFLNQEGPASAGAEAKAKRNNSTSEKNKASVQIGDPFYGKLLMEACLSAMRKNLVSAAQDMGAAGLISSSFEMISKGHKGMKMQLDQVPLRDSTMTPEEILLSESQERALLAVAPDKYNAVKKVFEQWGLRAQAIAELTQKKEVEIFWKKEQLLRIDPTLLTKKAPRYQRPYHPWKAHCRVPKKEETLVLLESSSSLPTLEKEKTASSKKTVWFTTTSPNVKNQKAKLHRSSPIGTLLSLLKDVRACDRHSIYRQYDQRVGARTVKDSSFPLGVIRLPHSGRALSIRMGGRPSILRMDSFEGGGDSVYEPALQLAVRGFKPLALTDGLNFGSPEKLEVMSDFVACVEGIATASKALDTPVVSGNVSFYNETKEQGISPTPITVMVGIKDSLKIPNDSLNPSSTVSFVQGSNLGVYLISSHQLFCKGLVREVFNQPPAFYGSLEPDRQRDFIQKTLKAVTLSPPLAVRVVGKFGLLYTLSRLLIGPAQTSPFMGLEVQTNYDPFQERLYEFVAVLPKEALPLWQKVFSEKEPVNKKESTTGPRFKIEKIGHVCEKPVLYLGKERLPIKELQKAYHSHFFTDD